MFLILIRLNFLIHKIDKKDSIFTKNLRTK